MDFVEMQERAAAVRRRYAEAERTRYGRAWTTEEIALGFVGDVGDLAKLVQGKAGVGRATTWTRRSPTSSPTACGAC